MFLEVFKRTVFSYISEQHLNENMMGEKFTIHFEIKKKIHLHLEVFWGVL